MHGESGMVYDIHAMIDMIETGIEEIVDIVR